MAAQPRQDIFPSYVVGLPIVSIFSTFRLNILFSLFTLVHRYLPPPVLDVLNNKRLEAAKRAAIITTALQWLFNSIPVAIIPIQFRAGLFLAQQIVPYLGYIGGFLAWSWGSIKAFDKGTYLGLLDAVIDLD